ncbi:NAD(P)H-binding protein [Streptomyces sp. NPDC050982]|uniref:NAD(P)H-binding protein n=1 Tax=Streptomyces sp. NPDC050982 TaxID=3154746 RepID=UPI00340A6850
MSQNQNITDVLMVGATGSIGQLAVRAARRQGLHPRALVRDPRRAEQLLPGVELVQGDLEDPASLRRAAGGADAIVLTHGSGGDSRPADLPVEAEPRRVRADLDAVRSLRGTSGTSG